MSLLGDYARHKMKTTSQKALINTTGNAISKIIEKSQNSPKNTTKNNLFNVPDSSSNLMNKNYLEVEELFKVAGFTNIVLIPKKDLINGWLTSDGSLHSIRVAGKSDFGKKEHFTPTALVEITYHTFKDSHATKQQASIHTGFNPYEYVNPETDDDSVSSNASANNYYQNTVNARLFCPFCGTKLFKVNDKFCSECGHKLM